MSAVSCSSFSSFCQKPWFHHSGSLSHPGGIPRKSDSRYAVCPDAFLVDCGTDPSASASPNGHLTEVERRYRTLVEQLPLVVYVDALDATSSNIFTSGQIEPLLGYTVEEWQTNPD